MRFKTIEEVLAWTGVFHDHLAGEYQRLSERGERQRLDLLLKYLADHERLLQQSIERFRADAPERLRNTWFDMAPDVPLPGTLVEFNRLCQASDVQELVEIAVRFHDGVLAVYTSLRNQAPNESIRELFDSLVQLEYHEKLKMVRGAQQLEDV